MRVPLLPNSPSSQHNPQVPAPPLNRQGGTLQPHGQVLRSLHTAAPSLLHEIRFKLLLDAPAPHLGPAHRPPPSTCHPNTNVCSAPPNPRTPVFPPQGNQSHPQKALDCSQLSGTADAARPQVLWSRAPPHVLPEPWPLGSTRSSVATSALLRLLCLQSSSRKGASMT